MRVSSQTETRQGLYAILIALPLTLMTLGGSVGLAAFVL